MISDILSRISRLFASTDDIKDTWYEESDDYMLD